MAKRHIQVFFLRSRAFFFHTTTQVFFFPSSSFLHVLLLRGVSLLRKEEKRIPQVSFVRRSNLAYFVLNSSHSIPQEYTGIAMFFRLDRWTGLARSGAAQCIGTAPHGSWRPSTDPAAGPWIHPTADGAHDGSGTQTPPEVSFIYLNK